MMLLFFFFLFLFPLSLIRCDDSQEALLNRNNRAAGSFSPSVSAEFGVAISDGSALCTSVLAATNGQFNCAMGCLVDSDCTWRLGSQITKVQYPLSSSSSSTFFTSSLHVEFGNFDNAAEDQNQATNHINELQVMCNVRSTIAADSSVLGFSGNIEGLVNPSCDGFLADECYSYQIYNEFTRVPCFDEPASGLNDPGFIQGSNTLFQTAVNYPNMRCLSGRCVHFLDDFPGYGEEYCLPQAATVTRSENQCALPQMTCNTFSATPPVFDVFGETIQGANAPIPFTPVQSYWGITLVPPFFSCPSGLGLIMEQRNSDATLVITPNDSGIGKGNPPQIYYSVDPGDIVGICSCSGDLACGPGMKCLPDNDVNSAQSAQQALASLVDDILGVVAPAASLSTTKNRCYCTSSSQCTFHGGGTQACLTNALVIGSYTGGIIGTCGCVAGQINSCSNNGICTAIQDLFSSNTFQTYYTVEQYALGAAKVPTPAGRCECWGQVKNVGTTWNETVTGPACEDDTYVDTKCNGHGLPICTILDPISKTSMANPVFGLNGQGIIGYVCDTQESFLNRGKSVCLCDLSFTPDTTTQPGVPSGTALCSIQSVCGSTPNGVQINGFCECTGDFFQTIDLKDLGMNNQVNTYGSCFPDCSLLKSYGRGVCFYNAKFVPSEDPIDLCPGASSTQACAGGISYTNDIECIETGWTTLYVTTVFAVNYFDTCFACTTTPPSLLDATVTRVEGGGQDYSISSLGIITPTPPFCTVPINPFLAPPSVNTGCLGTPNICGDPYGCGLSTQLTVGSWIVNQCICLPLQCTNPPLDPSFPNCIQGFTWTNGLIYDVVVDNGNNPILLYQPQSPIPYCARTCQFLTANMTDPSTPNAYNPVQPQICGGPRRGFCVSDGLGGTICACNVGYRGIACETRICPISNGFSCSGNGLCDASTEKCVCNFGFQGLACEFRSNNCAGSQCVRSYPLPNYNLPDF